MRRPDDKPVAGNELFRREAIAAQQNRWLGSVLLVPNISHSVYVGFAALVLAGVLGVFVFGEYTRTVRMSGWLEPEQGLIHIVAPQPGILTQVSAHEGREVTAGMPLAILSAERRSEAFGATQGNVIRQLQTRIESLRSEGTRHQARFGQEAATLAKRLAAMEDEALSLEREVELQRARLSLAERGAERLRQLRDRQIATMQDLQAAEESALDEALALQTLERDRTAHARTLLELEAERDQLPLREELQLAEIDRAIAALEQELAEAEAAREIVIVAPHDGTITAVQTPPGTTIGTQTVLMTLVPVASRLEARLYGPSRAIGFVRPGQRVMLRYEAFPYQKFGQYRGIVRSVSRATVGPTELSGRAVMSPGQASDEPLYRITVELAAQTANAYGEAIPLHPGMQLEADVLIETRRLYEWVLDPLISLTGRGDA